MKKKPIAVLLTAVILLGFSAVSASAFAIEDIYKIGDVNLDGAINIKDATELQKILAQLRTAKSEQLEKADVNYSGSVDISDVSLLQMTASGKYRSMAGKRGVDISSHNGDIDINKIKNAGYEFVMIRCGYGDNYTSQDDTRFAQNVKKCEQAKMPWGVYLFSYATSTQQAKSEIEHVDRLLKAERAKGYRPTMPVALDVEWSNYVESNGGWNYKNINNITTIFLDEIQKRGYYPMIYTGYSELDTMMSAYIRDNFDCWFAQWYTSPSSYKYHRLGMWQYGGEVNYLESNSISGVGVIDKNVSCLDYPMIIKTGGYNGW